MALAAVIAIVLNVLTAPHTLLAGDALEPRPSHQMLVGEIDTITLPGDDGGKWELGIHGSAGDLTTATAAERAGMSHFLAGRVNWVQRYSYNESSAWEKDFKRAALGGIENSVMDSVDLQFYVGHGWPGGFTFDNATKDDGSLVPNDCFRAWGDNDNEWLALTSCQVLATSNLSQWASCMSGQHLILGFVTNASAYNNKSSTQAYHFGRYIDANYKMAQAWYKACDVAQRGRTTRAIINELACLDDKPNSNILCADSFDTDWWYQTHACGTETAVFVPAEVRALPVFRMAPYSLDDAVNDFERLGAAFNVPVTSTIQAALTTQDQTGFFTATIGSLALDMDKQSGIYNFSDLDELWTAEQAQRAMQVSVASPNYIHADDAKVIADAFLRDKGLTETDAIFYEVVSDTISSELTIATAENGLTAAEIMQDVTETPIVWQVIYSRRLNAEAVTVAGIKQELEFSVVGPGAKQKVYVPVAAEAGAASIYQTQPVGAQGGWRGIEPVINTATGQALMVEVLTPEQVSELYLTLPEDVPLNVIPLDISNREVITHTVAYWEEAPGVNQGEMIPVYELLVRMTEAQSGDILDEYVYVPASELYMRPIARILDAPMQVEARAGITLTAADASQTLRQLGLADYDFALGSGQATDYTYRWTADDQPLGEGRTLTDVVLPYPEDNRERTVRVQLIVTDNNSPNESFSTANIVIVVKPILFIPSVVRADAGAR